MAAFHLGVPVPGPLLCCSYGETATANVISYFSYKVNNICSEKPLCFISTWAELKRLAD